MFSSHFLEKYKLTDSKIQIDINEVRYYSLDSAMSLAIPQACN